MSHLTRFTSSKSLLLALTVVLTGAMSQSTARAASYKQMAYAAYEYSELAAKGSYRAYLDLYDYHTDYGYTYRAYVNAKKAKAEANEAYLSGAALSSEYAYDAMYYSDLAFYYAEDAYMYASEGNYEDAMLFAGYAYDYAYEAATYNYFVYLGY